MAILTKAQLQADNSASFADNNTQAITPLILRSYNGNVIDTLVDSLDTGSFARTAVSNDFTAANSFTSISASSFISASAFTGDGSRLTNITASTALPISEEGVLLGYATQLNFSGSNISASLAAGIATISVTVNNLVTTSSFNQFTASTNTFTASVDTKFTAVGSSTASLNSFTASQTTKDSTLAIYTASVNNSISALNQFTASQSTSSIVTSITNLNSFTSSQETKNTTLASYTGSNDTKWNTLGGQTGSFITESETGSFARTNVGNNFTGSNTFVAGYNTEFDGNVFIGQNQNIINGGLTNLTISSTSTNGLSLTSPNSNITLTAGGQIIPKSFISSSLAITASFFVGDGSQLTNLPTNPPLTSLNAFTASQLTINSAIGVSTSSLNTFTASAQISINALNTFTASQSTASLVTSITNLNTFTSSQLTINSAIGASTSSLNTFSSSVLTQLNTLANVTSSLISKTGSYATTGSNTFIGDQTITGNITAFSASFTYLQTIFESSSVIYSSGSNQFGDELSDTQTLSGSVKVQGSLTINGTPVQTSSVDISALNSFTSSQLTINTAIQASTSSLNTFSASTLTRLTNIESTTASLNSSVAALNTFTASQSTASLVTSITNLNTFSASALVSISNLNSFTSSQETKDTTLASVTSSLNTATASLFTSASLGLTTASVNLNTITFTKGNNTTFSIIVNTGSAVTTDISALNSFTSSQETKDTTLAIYTASVDTKFTAVGSSTSSLNTATASLFTSASLGLTTASVSLNTITFTKGDATTFSITVNTGSATSTDITALNSFTSSQETKDTTLASVTSSLNTATASLFTSASLGLTTASFSGNTLTFTKGNGTTFGIVIPDVSGSGGTFATTGSNSFIGNQTITGSLTLSSSAAIELQVIGNSVFTGSAFGNVVALSITSNTASMDLNLGNYFTLTLAGTATTHISASNVQPGVSATLVITTGTNSSASLAPTMLQPSGSSYSATNGSGKKDVLSIVAVASGVPFVVSTKNMI